MKIMRKILSVLLVCVMAICLCAPAFSASNFSLPDIGDDGTWATDANRELVVGALGADLNSFRPPVQLVQDYVPIEAKIGLAFMNAMAHISKILDNSLVGFIIYFIFLMTALWIMFETYKMMADGKGKIADLWVGIVKKAVMIAMWVIVLRYGIAQVFLLVVGPILKLSTIVSDFILNTVSSTAGIALPDTCSAIHTYVLGHMDTNALLDADALTSMLCVPTRMSGVSYTAIAAGWNWMISGIGSSLFTFVGGLVFVVMFILVAWKFAFLALGVLADLFLGVMMLPFTAVKETLGSTGYKGIPGQIFNYFLKIFNAQSLSDQISRFIQAALYFVSLSIVIAFCFALMGGTFSTDFTVSRPVFNNDGFWISVLTAGLVWWFADRAMDIAKNLGGSIDSAIGDKIQSDAQTLGGIAAGKAKTLGGIVADKAKGVWEKIRNRGEEKK